MAAAAGSRLPSRRALFGALIVGFALLGAAALLYATSTGTAWLADRAERLGNVDIAVTQTEVGQHRIAQALLLATDLEAGIATPQILAESVDGARQTLAGLESQVAALDDPELASKAAAYADSGSQLLDRLEAGALDEARSLAGGEVSSGYVLLSAHLASTRDGLLADIGSAKSWGGVAATVTGVILALLAPVTMVVAYRALARRQLKRAELEAKLAAEGELSRTKDEFIANVSHELRTPLTGIYGFAQVLEEGSMFDPETAHELLSLIINQAGELGRMVDDLLTAARANAGVLSYELQVVQLEPELAEVVPAFERLEGPIPVLCEHLPVVADPIRLRQVLRNLIANARKHGGPNVQVIGQQVEEHYEVAVVDDGFGIADHLLPIMFERFMHSGDKPLVAGSVGLGLNIARTLARGMGGDIEYRRRDGLTQLVLTLSLAPPIPEAEAEQAREAANA